MDLILNPKLRTLRHLLIWLMVAGVYLIFFGYGSSRFNYSLLLSLLMTPMTVAQVYLLHYRLIPHFLLSGKLGKFLIYSTTAVLLAALIVLSLLILSTAYIPEMKASDLPPAGRNSIFLITLMILLVAAMSFLSMWKRQQQNELEAQKLQEQLLTAESQQKEQELSYLKSQIHPHFLFNALNTLYGSALKKSEETPEMILKLSSLLDYTLYQSGKEKVALAEEIDHIEQYIALEQMRFRETLEIDFQQEIGNTSLELPPMLLLPFVENAFKHGSVKKGVLAIQMRLSASENELRFQVSNSTQNKPDEPGIGLKNLRKRLEVLYPQQHLLSIDENNGTFSVDLILKHPNKNTAWT